MFFLRFYNGKIGYAYGDLFDGTATSFCRKPCLETKDSCIVFIKRILDSASGTPCNGLFLAPKKCQNLKVRPLNNKNAKKNKFNGS